MGKKKRSLVADLDISTAHDIWSDVPNDGETGVPMITADGLGPTALKRDSCQWLIHEYLVYH